MSYIEQIKEACRYLQERVSQQPEIGIVLGSGLGDLGDSIEQSTIIPYAEIPHFRHSTAIGHKGNLIFGMLGGHRVMAMQGRFHYYEGYTMQEVTFPIRVMALMGVKTLFVSNAAGAVNPHYKVGDLMIITDHINLMPNPLIGANLDEFGVRFPDMTTTYSRRIRLIALQVAQQMNLNVQQGVYVGGTGPSYETPAEYKFFATIGGDAVGMSTIPEVIVARHSNMEIFGMSIISNQSNDLSENHLNDGNDVIEAAAQATKTLSTLFRTIISKL
ncbi:MAG: purine-nucleoside phosphorylase [Bacteroidales bacterium]|nr:purine-nucleoside phosphorylase [Bacteroidales bacterium]